MHNFSIFFYAHFVQLQTIYRFSRYGNRFVTFSGPKKAIKTPVFQVRTVILGLFSLGQLTRRANCATFYVSKALTKDMRSQKEPQRGAHLVRGLRYTAGTDTTFRAAGRKCSDGHARYRVNE